MDLILAFTSATPRQTANNLPELPNEILLHITSYCSKRDLVSLAVVSRRFHQLATQALYTKVHIDLLKNENITSSGKKHLPASSCLDALTTSEYDYARHMRELVLDYDKSERPVANIYKPYQLHGPMGKMFNTLAVLAMRKAVKLESLVWRMPFEMSSRLCQTLHNIETLYALEVRIQSEPLVQQKPRPQSNPWDTLDFPATTQSSAPAFDTWFPAGTAQHVDVVGLPPSNILLPPPSPHQMHLNAGGANQFLSPSTHAASTSDVVGTASDKSHVKACLSPSFSGFKNLRTLAVVNIHDLAISSEIQQCIQNCARTLACLKLSMTTELSNSSRKVIAPNLAPVNAATAQQGDKALLTLQAKIEQDGLLARIFGIKPHKDDLSDTAQGGEKSDNGAADDSDKGKAHEPSAADNYLLNSISGALQAVTFDLDSDADRAAWEDRKKTALAQVSHLFDEYMEMKADKGATSSMTHQEKTGFRSGSDATRSAVEDQPGSKESVSLFGNTPARTSKTLSSRSHTERDVLPDDIDVETPEGQLDLHPLDGSHEGDGCGKDLENGADKVTDEASAETTTIGEKTDKETSTTAEVSNHGDQLIHAAPSSATAAIDFARSTRGLSLKTFSCHLIPVYASVLRKAVDLTRLMDLTLLNVGPQSAIWKMIAKENASSSLPLASVRTDNVTMSCLECLGSLTALEKIYLRERDQHNASRENPAGKTTLTIKDIRRHVLRPHASKLTVLSICNYDSEEWDLDSKTIRLLSRQAKKLRELAGCMKMDAVHAVMQQLSDFNSLQALHIVELHNDDTCMWAIQEVKKYFADMLTQCPDLGFKYLAISDSPVVHLVDRTAAKKQLNHQTQATASTGSDWSIIDTDDDGYISSDDDEGESPSRVVLEFKPRNIDSISTVTIFQKDIRLGVI
ncbi:hypothetical protein SBRCBS47491_007371 [Sporothrix bragantina]|uniref:F-box domain-containing protein n=1 Tax=Sporothrix bragantina TaxID=671064 RepID=A0ABP0CCN9_9PEZI